MSADGFAAALVGIPLGLAAVATVVWGGTMLLFAPAIVVLRTSPSAEYLFQFLSPK